MHDAERYDRTLRRTIAMLVALAVLAERAAPRSFPVRWLVLVVLRRAEAVAHAYVVEATDWMWPGFEEELESGCSPVDASLLALRLRMLAAILGALLAPAEHLADDHDRAARAADRLAPRGGDRSVTPGFLPPAPNDTS
jgi:hypothetical protein